jgi:hypothetical protein
MWPSGQQETTRVFTQVEIMEQVMNKNKFTLSAGQLHEIEMAFAKAGWTHSDVKKLISGAASIAALEAVREHADGIRKAITIRCLKNDVEEKWKNLGESKKSSPRHRAYWEYLDILGKTYATKSSKEVADIDSTAFISQELYNRARSLLPLNDLA